MFTRRPIKHRRLVSLALLALVVPFVVVNVVIGIHQLQERNYRRDAFSVVRAAFRDAVEVNDNTGRTRKLVRDQHGDVVYGGAPVKCSLTGSTFQWCPSMRPGVLVPLYAETRDEARVFYACSKDATPDGRRNFVFPSPRGSQILSDSDIDWSQHSLKRDSD